MERRAVLVRSGFGSLAGGRNGVECIGSLLRGYGFATTECDGPTAKHDDIVAAIDRLIAVTTSDDAAVIYYSGHARLVRNSKFVPGGPVPPFVEHICPTDYGSTTDQQFLGITAPELSRLFGRFRSKNVTVIWDCCYAGQLGRGDVQPPLWPPLTYATLENHFTKLRAADPDFDKLTVAGNTEIVRVAAADQTNMSFVSWLPPATVLAAVGIECSRTDEYIGELTRALVQIVAPLRGRRASWAQILPELRSRLPSQRPEIRGPIARVPFSLDVVDGTTLGLTIVGDRATLDAGSILGVSAGDIYGVMPAGATVVDPDKAIAYLTVDAVSAAESYASVDWKTPAHELPATSVAIAVQRVATRYPIRIDAPAELAGEIERAVEASPMLRVAADTDGDPIALLRVAGGKIVLSDAVGPLFPPADYAAHLGDAILDASNLATERRLHALESSLDISDLDIELGVVRGGGFVPIGNHASPVMLGELTAIRITNRSAEVRYVNAFDIGFRRTISPLDTITVQPGASNTAGIVQTTRQLCGFETFWPEGLDRDQARTESMMVVVTRNPVDLGVVQSTASLPTTRGADTALQQVFAQAATGQTRGGEAAGSVEPEPFAVSWLDFTVVPIEGSTDIGVPAIDESSSDSSLAPRDGNPIELRIDNLAAGARIDVLVCTGDPSHPVVATTCTAAGTIWRGQPAVEVFVWTSTTSDHRPLDTLLHVPASMTSALGTRALASGASLAIAAAARQVIGSIAGAVTTTYRGFIDAAASPARAITTPLFTLSIGKGL